MGNVVSLDPAEAAFRLLCQLASLEPDLGGAGYAYGGAQMYVDDPDAAASPEYLERIRSAIRSYGGVPVR